MARRVVEIERQIADTRRTAATKAPLPARPSSTAPPNFPFVEPQPVAPAPVAPGAQRWKAPYLRAAFVCRGGGHVPRRTGRAAVHLPCQKTSSAASTADSAVAAAHAVLLVSGGWRWRHAGNRMLGTGLIGLMAVKLYLYDAWLLAAFYRMAAFAILGVLLVVSDVYSRRA